MSKNADEIIFLAPNLMSICVDGRKDSDINGRLYHRGQKDSFYFGNSGQLIIEMEQWCNKIGYPQPEVLIRKFQSREVEGKRIEKTGTDSGEDRNKNKWAEEALSVSGEDLSKNRGEEGTFIVHIKYRQNATWQGQVTWAEKKKNCNFRSALELIKLIDSALEDGSE